MKLSKAAFAALALPVLALVAPLSALAIGRAAVRVDDKDEQFRQRFLEMMRINATKEMAKLVRSMTDQAVYWIIETAEAISNQTSEDLETRMAALRSSWKEAMETNFGNKVYEYFSLLEPSLKVERTKLKSRYDKAQREYVANLQGAKDSSKFNLLSGTFEGLAQAFEVIGDKYFASQAWILQGSCNREDVRGADADLYATCAAYKKAVADREEIELKDNYWSQTKQKYESLANQGFDREKPTGAEPSTGGAPSGPPAPASEPASSGAAITAAMGFARVTDPFQFERPTYYDDELYQTWNYLYLQGRGSSTKVNTLGPLSPTAMRVGANEIRIDADGDGEGEIQVPITGNLEPVEFEIGAGAERRRWACLTTLGTDKEYYQAMQINLAPTDDSYQLYFVPAASVVGEIGGESVRVFDDNGDGIYGTTEPPTWQHRGIHEGDFQPELDSIAIGSSKRARPWSEYQEVGGQWYQLASAQGGKQLQATPVEVETGTLKLKFKGGKPAWLVVRGRGKLEHSYFDLAEGSAEVPAGTYALFYGELRKGKKRQVQKAVILPGPSTPTWTVEAGGTTTVELGAPFRFDFTFERKGESAIVSGKSVLVLGSGNERYERLWDCVPRPDVSWREAGSKRGSKPEEMDLVLDQEKLGELGWDSAWFPLDLAVELKGDPKGIELQLTEKKNKLFGSIESDWKGK